jgi:hypothetical protein
MKPLHPAVKWPLAVFLAAIVLAPGLKAFQEDPADRKTREFGEQMDKFTADMEKERARTNNR